MLNQSYGRTLPLTVFLLSLNLLGFQIFGCPPEFWTEEGNAASDVFIQFVQENLGENWAQKMNEKKYGNRGYSTPWEKEIIPSTRNWSAKDAQEFLDILVSRVGEQNTCHLLARALSHIKNIPHQREKISQDILQNFKDRMDYYDEYMGEEETTEMMRKALAGFTQGLLVRTKELTQFLEDFFGSKEPVIVVFTRDPHTYSITRIDEIQPVLNFLEILIGHETLTALIARKKEDSKQGRYLSIAKLRVLQILLQPLINNEIAVATLKRKNSTQTEILKLVELNYDHLFRIQKQVRFWMTYSGLPAVAKAMKKSLDILFEDEFHNIEKKVKVAEKEAPDKKTVIAFTKKHPDLFVTSSVEGFLESFRKWRAPSEPKTDIQEKPPTQQQSKHRVRKNQRGSPGQMILSFPPE